MFSEKSTPQSNPEIYNDAWFKKESLEAFRDQLALKNYPGYPSFEQRLWIDDSEYVFEPVLLADGPWETSETVLPSIRERQALSDLVNRYDIWGRPLHPWYDNMVSDPSIRILTGKGFYWNWGPNFTADAIITRNDLDEPHILLVERADTHQWALPGGFIDPGESALEAAVREVQEETLLELSQFAPMITQTYSGPLADLRTTANAWPETTAFRFDIPDGAAQDLAVLTYSGSEETPTVTWLPVSQIQEHMFGSHGLLIKQALEK